MSDAYIQIRLRRSTSIATLVSILVHALLLFLLSRQELFKQGQPAADLPRSISVRLYPRPAARPAQPEPDKNTPPVSPPQAAEKPRLRTQPAMPDVIAATKPEQATTRPSAEPRAPAPAKPALDPAQFPDMASYLKAVREKRGDSGNEETAASDEEARTANIQRNLQQPGSGGVFQINSMDAHTATFSFRGWKGEYSYSRREVYQVDAGLNGDIHRAVVRRMIEIIRQQYSGDFKWESPRLGRVVVLSARRQDNDGLEDFLLEEFFGTQGISAR